MPEKKPAKAIPPFTEEHHALLLAWLAKALCERVGKARGEAVTLKAVRRYGEERGERMARRAKANGHDLSMDDYIAYGEIEIARGAMEQKLSKCTNGIALQVTRCPWCTAWRKEGLMTWGGVYCREIDKALVRGFNPALTLEVEGTMSNGSPSCSFVFRGAGNMPKIAWRKLIKPGRKALMPWDFHIGHVFSTLQRVFVQELGEDGAVAIEAGVAEFGRHFGDASLRQLRILKENYERR